VPVGGWRILSQASGGSSITPTCRRTLTAANVALAGWLLWRAYDGLLVDGAWRASVLGAVDLIVAVLIVARPPPERLRVDLFSIAVTLISNGHFALFVGHDATGTAQSTGAAILLGMSALLAATARIVLGRSYAWLPAVRDLRTGGPYRFVRHPIYLASILADVAFVLILPSARNFALASVGISAHVIRAQQEEAIWSQRASFRAYARRTRWRLVPWLY
jgi:protein-S-isoprenylcysteine O-methyltransferase Ste14